MNTRSRKAVTLLTQPALLLVLVATAFAAIVPALADTQRQRHSASLSESSASDNRATRKKATLARHHRTMPFFSFTTGG